MKSGRQQSAAIISADLATMADNLAKRAYDAFDREDSESCQQAMDQLREIQDSLRCDELYGATQSIGEQGASDEAIEEAATIDRPKTLGSRGAEPELSSASSAPSSGTEELLLVDLHLCQIRWREKCHNVSSEGAHLMDAIVKADGQYITAGSIVHKPSRILQKLPPEIQHIVETTNKGYRLRIDRAKNVQSSGQDCPDVGQS